MKIAVVSDIHSNLANFKKALDWIKKEKVKVLIHCGDMGSPMILREIAEAFSGEIHLVFGNIEDRYRLTKIVYGLENKNAFLHEEVGEIEVDGRKIAFCHFPKVAKALAQSQKYNLVFYGHTHKPWEEKVGKCRLVNPGNLLGAPYKPTFAIFDTKTNKLELKILEKLG